MADAARLLLLAAAVAAALAGRSDGAWCVCRPELPDSTLQKTLDYACGAGADCKPILQSGACFAPDTVKAHCSYAVNSFYQRNNQNPQACIFSGTTILSTNDPSSNNQSTTPPSDEIAATGASTLRPRDAAGTSTTGGTGGTSGMYSPPTLGPSSLDNNIGAGDLLVAGVAKKMVIWVCCSLMLLYFRA
ncbi:hypothetical protein ACP70R_024458 [Stipagrostis hirtigluma subsp. patula]